MGITTCGLWTLIHGVGFGGMYLLACSVALVGRHPGGGHRLPDGGGVRDPRQQAGRDGPLLYILETDRFALRRDHLRDRGVAGKLGDAAFPLADAT